MPELFPVQAKGPAITRPELPSALVKVQKNYHKAMEQGRFLESSIGDATFWAKNAKKDLEDKIKLWIKLQLLGVDGQQGDKVRPFLYIKDVIEIIKEMKALMDEVIGVIQALIQIVQLLIAIKNKMQAMIQGILNALATLIAEICNWKLPDLPSLPNLFGDLVWGWNGFNLNFNFNTKFTFDTKFAFGNCKVVPPNLDIFRNYPKNLNIGGVTYGNQVFNPPIGGIIPTMNQLNSKDYYDSFVAPASQTSPVLSPDFNPNSDMAGSLPKAEIVVSNFSMPPSMFEENVVALILPEAVPQVDDPDYNDIQVPNNGLSSPNASTQARRLDLYNLFSKEITLAKIIDNNFDLNRAAAWVLYLKNARTLRKGLWIPEFQHVFEEFIQPTIAYLEANPVPYNSFEGEVKRGPKSLPLIDKFISFANADDANHTYWMLSFIEAGLLGYTREVRWDSYASDDYLSRVTLDDLDFFPATYNSTFTSIVESSNGKANYPQLIKLPSLTIDLVNQAVAKGEVDIENHTTWRTSRTQYKFVYDQFANATEVDRYSQFWREWSGNFDSLMQEDGYVPYVMNYWLILDSAVSPLASGELFSYLKTDYMTRDLGWKPGDGLLNLPKAVYFNIDPGWRPDDSNNGWSADGKTFDEQAFISRPDILALPIPTQMAMMDLNKSYATVLKFRDTMSAAIDSEITAIQATIDEASSVVGFQVSTSDKLTLLTNEPYVISFPTIVFDHTKNVADPTKFIVKKTGDYTVAGAFYTSTSSTPATRKVEILVNGKTLLSNTSDKTTNEALIGLSGALPLVENDEVQIFISQDGVNPVELLQDSTVSFMVTVSDPTVVAAQSASYGYPVGIGSILNLTASFISTSGKILPIHPELDVSTPPWFDGITLKPGKADESVPLAMEYGKVYSIDEPVLSPGMVMFAGPNGVINQDYNTTAASCRWIVVVGKAISPTEFVFQPHLPTDQAKSGGGASVNDSNYVHEQTTPSSAWVVHHNLGKYVSVDLAYDNGQQFDANIIYGTDADPNDLNTVRVFMTRAITGKAICN